jgi:Ca2+-binding RTX toxin-like protein
MTAMNILGTDGDDTIDAFDGAGSEHDYLIGFDGDDKLFGLGGDDWLAGGSGADHLDGGANSDYAMYGDSSVGVLISLWQNFAYGGSAEGDTFVSIENLSGSEFDDILIGDGGTNLLSGNGGGDNLKGGGGIDGLFGLDGHDVLEGGAGGDMLDGGDGTDTAAYGKSAQGVSVDLNSGSAFGGDAEGDWYISVENLTGSHHDDYLAGNDQDNVLKGQEGEDVLKGVGGVDTLYGGGDDDDLYGNDGVDVLRGEGGEDRLTGGAGEDMLFGGANADTFVWKSTNETSVIPVQADRIFDFYIAQGDRIDLSGIDANVYAIGNQAFTFIGTAAFSGTPGEIRYYHADGHTFLEMQTGTSVDVEGVIRVNGIHTPEASWFVL